MVQSLNGEQRCKLYKIKLFVTPDIRYSFVLLPILFLDNKPNLLPLLTHTVFIITQKRCEK